jgi:hypothetical protein
VIKAFCERDGRLSPKESMSLSKIRLELDKIAAERAKEEQAALGGGPATNFLRRASGG